MTDIFSSSQMKSVITVFISYACKDKALKDRLEEHLSNLKYRGLITTWHDRDISAGDDWEYEASTHLEKASIVLILISASFMASHYCYCAEMGHALERHHQGMARVIPVLLRPVMFTDAPFAKLQSLPSNGKPVVTWRNRDSAFVDIALGIERALRQIPPTALTSHSSNWRDVLKELPEIEEPLISLVRGDLLLRRNRVQDALAAYEQAIRCDDQCADAYYGMGQALARLGKTSEAEQAYERAYHQYERAYYQEALSAYERAVEHNHSDLAALKGKGTVLEALKRYDEAIDVFRQVVARTPHSLPYTKMGDIFLKMNQAQEAVFAYEQAIRYDEQYVLAYYGMGQALARLGKTSEAEQAYERARQLGYED